MKQSPCYFNIIEKDLKYCVFVVLMFAKQNKKTHRHVKFGQRSWQLL